jgi:hypothetical protein
MSELIIGILARISAAMVQANLTYANFMFILGLVYKNHLMDLLELKPLVIILNPLKTFHRMKRSNMYDAFRW